MIVKIIRCFDLDDVTFNDDYITAGDFKYSQDRIRILGIDMEKEEIELVIE